MADDKPTNGFAKTEWRLEQAEKRLGACEEATKWLAEAGARHNEQINAAKADAQAVALALEKEAERRGKLEEAVTAQLNKLLWGVVMLALSVAGAAIAFAYTNGVTP